MNLSEIFFFKVFEGVKESNNKLNKSSHNEKNCYFYHNSEDYFEKDKRRELISFSSFFKQLRTNLEEGDIILTIDTIFEFKNRENNFSLNYYTNKPSFSNYNNCIYNQFDYCKNEVEFFYHIKNYKKSKCKHQEINKTCKKKFCNKYHNKNELDENEKNGINYFIKIIDSWIDKNEIKLIEIIEVFNTIISTKNRFLSGLQLNEIKQDFEPFLKFYNEYQKTKNFALIDKVMYANQACGRRKNIRAICDTKSRVSFISKHGQMKGSVLDISMSHFSAIFDRTLDIQMYEKVPKMLINVNGLHFASDAILVMQRKKNGVMLNVFVFSNSLGQQGVESDIEPRLLERIYQMTSDKAKSLMRYKFDEARKDLKRYMSDDDLWEAGYTSYYDL